jgi:hypothetical protein
MKTARTIAVAFLGVLGATGCGAKGSAGSDGADSRHAIDLQGHSLDVSIESTTQAGDALESSVLADGTRYVIHAEASAQGGSTTVSLTTPGGSTAWVIRQSPDRIAQQLTVGGETVAYASSLVGTKRAGSAAEAERALADAVHSHLIPLADVRRLDVLLPTLLEVGDRWAANGEIGQRARDALFAVASERLAHQRVFPAGGRLSLKDDSGNNCDPYYDPECADDAGAPPPAQDSGSGTPPPPPTTPPPPPPPPTTPPPPPPPPPADNCPTAQKSCNVSDAEGDNCAASCGNNFSAYCNISGGYPVCGCNGC